MIRTDASPLISIITVVFNGVLTIESSILSVIHQSYPNIEYIIIDGQSTDGTIDLIKKYIFNINYFVTEKDLGIYDAMNKGITNATGDYLYFLGCDDFLVAKDTIANIVNTIKTANTVPAIIIGNVDIPRGKIIKSSYSNKILLHNTIHHQACLYKKSLFEHFRYDTNLKILSDYELNLIVYLKKMDVLTTSIVFAICNQDGASTVKKNYFLHILETNLIRKKYLNSYINYFYKMIFTIKAFTIYVIRYI